MQVCITLHYYLILRNVRYMFSAVFACASREHISVFTQEQILKTFDSKERLHTFLFLWLNY